MEKDDPRVCDNRQGTLHDQDRPPFFNRLAPNILTMLGLCSGLTGMRVAMDGAFEVADVALLISAIIDGLDGRVARLLRGSTRFGAQFDSLSDFLCFGVAPSFVMYFWALKDAGRYAFLPCLLFSVCMALRLSRFNADLDDDTQKPVYASQFFTGVPAPAGAGLTLFPLFLGLEAQKLGLDGLYHLTRFPWLPALSLCGTGFLAGFHLASLVVQEFQAQSADFATGGSSGGPLRLGDGR